MILIRIYAHPNLKYSLVQIAKMQKAGDQFYTGNSWVTGCYGQKSVLTVSGVTSAKTASATVKVTVKYNGVTLTKKTTVIYIQNSTETKSYNLKASKESGLVGI